MFSFTVLSTRSDFHASICRASSIRSATRNSDRPAARATKGSTAPASVQLVANEMQATKLVLKPDPVLTLVPAVGNQLELLLEKRMVRMCYSQTSNLNIAMRRS